MPEWGGKTVSIRHLATGHELLFQRPRKPPRRRDEFGDWAFGWDDCWPSVDAGEPGYPDHGALWRLCGKTKPSDGLTVEIEPPDQSWRYTKTWNLDGSSLKVGVRIDNLSPRPLPAFWTLHALVRFEDDMVLVFPGGDKRMTVHGQSFFPRAYPPPGTAGKFWLPGEVSRGWCGIDYPTLGMEYRLSWNPDDLPYLGYWVTNGGFRGERNAAWEPSDGFFDSVATTQTQGTLPILAPGQTKAFSFTLSWRPLV
jgi:hypothetical protein